VDSLDELTVTSSPVEPIPAVRAPAQIKFTTKSVPYVPRRHLLSGPQHRVNANTTSIIAIILTRRGQIDHAHPCRRPIKKDKLFFFVN